MSGHSKWSTIKNKKEKADSKRAKIFTKIGREISVAVKLGGADLATNSRLRDVVNKAKANNVPNENIERIIKKASKEGEKKNFFSVSYEGYGPQGVAVLVNALTDNKNRTAANIRHYFDKFGGNLGSSGCVSYLFKKQGIICLKVDEQKEDYIVELCINLSAVDCEVKDSLAKVVVESDRFYFFVERFKKEGFELIFAEIEEVPSSFINVKGEEELKNMEKLIKSLENDEDVSEFWTNYKKE